MINIVKENENAEIGFPTLDRYKEVYQLLLSNYLLEYIDNTERRFIELQIEHYKTYCDEFLNNPKYCFNKWQLERFNTSRFLLIEYLELKQKGFVNYYENLSDLKLPINENASKLFEWFVEYYRPDQKKSVKFINILHYFKNDANKEIYTFDLTQLEYKEMIKKKFDINITKFAKSEQYLEVEKPILKSKERNFIKSRGEN